MIHGLMNLLCCKGMCSSDGISTLWWRCLLVLVTMRAKLAVTLDASGSRSETPGTF
jgi:hypothetical protein